MKIIKYITIITIALTIGACSNDSAQDNIPKPAVLTDDAIGHSDKMIVVNHIGPKSQIFLANQDEPLWFSSVRDGLAYYKSPEKTAKILAFYVNDVGAGKSWQELGKGDWIDAKTAYFVYGSDAIGGMGAPEFVPFSDKEKALEFAKERGGELLSLDDIDAEMVLAPVDHSTMQMPMNMQDGEMKMDMPMDGQTQMNMQDGQMQMEGEDNNNMEQMQMENKQ